MGGVYGAVVFFELFFLRFGRLPRAAKAALAMHLHCSGVLRTLIGHMERPHPPGTQPEAALRSQTGATKHAICPMLQLCAFVDASGRL